MGTPKESGNPLNIDPKTWRVAPEQSRFANAFRKSESPSLQGADKPAVQEVPEEFDLDIEIKPMPPATWVGPFGRDRSRKPKNHNTNFHDS
jgi:hypothetical protein